jgi:hypothetical protein
MQKDLGRLVAAAAVAGEAEIGLPEAAGFDAERILDAHVATSLRAVWVR